MWHTLRTRRGVGLTVLMIVVALACVRLGIWQFDRAHRLVTQQVAASSVPITAVLQPRVAVSPQDVGRPITLTGRFVPSADLVVLDRASTSDPQTPGVWALSAFRLDGGGYVPVVRGWAGSATDIAAPPRGQRSIKGILQASENSAAAPPNAGILGPSEVDIVSAAQLIDRYPPGDLYDAFVVLTPPSPGLQPVDTTVVSTQGWRLINAGYALQWWAFAAFAVFMWVRVLREDEDD